MKFGIFYELQLPRPWGVDDERQLYQNALSQVELADLADNLRNNRRLESTSAVRARITRYEAAQRVLEAWAGAE